MNVPFDRLVPQQKMQLSKLRQTKVPLETKVPFKGKPKPRSGLHPMSLRTRLSARDRDECILEFLEYLDTPRALTSWLLYKNREHRQLVSLAIDPISDYTSDMVDVLRRDYAATKFFSKCDNLETGINTKEVAIDSALYAEDQCRMTNKRIKECVTEGFPPDIATHVLRAQYTVSRILGSLKAGMFSDLGWSKGRTTAVFGNALDPVNKYLGRLDVTPQALSIAVSVVGSSHSWGAAALNADGPTSVLASAFTLRDGNVLTVVPKNAKTDRTICYEPHCNIRLQLPVGSYLKRRLLRRGVDLYDQSINQRLVKKASLDGAYATIDLKSASDTLSTSVVELMLNHSSDWFDLLDSLRCRYTEWPDGAIRENEKFSSMGNGFTFELESLIFYALCYSVTPEVSVYGDDIIVPTHAYDEVTHLLTFMGFAVNSAKSFSTGFFRESCGADMYRGCDLTPVYLRTLPKVRGDLIKLHNAVRDWAKRGQELPMVEPILAKWRKVHPSFVGPTGTGDFHYHVALDVAMPLIRRDKYGCDLWWYKTHARYAREFKDDILTGYDFTPRAGFAALCVATGPKRARSLYDQVVEWKQERLVTIWSSTPSWE